MRIALDAQLTIGTATGIGEYIRGLASTLRAYDNIELRELTQPRYDPWRFDRRVVWDQVLLPLAARRAQVELLHCTAGTMPFLQTVPSIVTVHDVAWLRVQRHTKIYARTYFGPFALACYRKARRIIVDSDFSRRELLALAHDTLDEQRIDVIYPGVAEDIFRVIRNPDTQPFILAVGTVEQRKNLAVIIRALRHLPTAIRLISVGPFTPYRDECLRIAHECGVAERVEFRGYIARTELLDLYARATLAAVPSHYEGFGYGVAQALCAGVPCLAAASSSLVEVAGDDATLLPPDDVTAWSDALATFLTQREVVQYRAEQARPRAQARFSWQQAAHATVTSYRAALGL